MQKKSLNLFSPPTTFDSTRWRNMRVGILGGSFNPPHEAHVYVSEIAIKRLNLDAVWWMVTPQNPFKTDVNTLPFVQRLSECEQIAHHKKIVVSDIEYKNKLYRTIDSVQFIKKHFPSTEFVWLTGMDLVAEIPKWKNWQALLGEISFAHIIRPPTPTLVRNSAIHQLAHQKHIFNPNTVDKRRVELLPNHTYWILDTRGHKASSTEIRNKLAQYNS